MSQSYNPQYAETEWVWAVPRSLAATRGITHLFSSPAGNKMFQFPAFAYLTVWYTFSVPGCPIRKPVSQRLFAPKHRLSQLIASFIACESLGIHHTPLVISSRYNHPLNIH